ncbi:hypothetical protein [Oceanobacillus oncorhynchi]|uniref:hypothetical protein n=1 Tax=Oceanobacillus oncorhynchi TaxID=545501 RepID=UPI0034D5F910
MVEIFGKKYHLENLIFPILFVLSILIVGVNVFYHLKFDANIWNWNMGAGAALFAYTWHQLFYHGEPSVKLPPQNKA